MKQRFALFILTSFFLLHAEANNPPGKIKVLFTAAIISGDPKIIEKRNNDYIDNLKKLHSYGCDVYVVESCQTGPTFLDTHCNHVCYTKSNDPNRSKSNNEIISMRIGYEHFKFHPNDMIIKITGRYVLQTDEFIRFVKLHMDADLIARIWGPGDIYTGLFAIKASTLLDFMDNFYLDCIGPPESSQYLIPRCAPLAFEHAIPLYIHRNHHLKIVPGPRLYHWLPRCGHKEG